MKRQNHLMLTLSCLFFVQCEDGMRPNTLDEIHSITMEPGQIYTLIFTQILDTLPSQTTYAGREELLKTPLHDLVAKGIIIKADDLKAQFTENWQRFFMLMDIYQIPHSAGLICQTIRNLSPANRQNLSDRLEAQCELWLHGWDHFLSDSRAEFQGASFQEQYQHLRWSLDLVYRELSYTMHTFGAPGNRIDDHTAAALLAIPELIVWLWGKPVPGLFTIPITAVAESSTGVARDLDSFQARFQRYGSEDVITLQIHPNLWSDDDFTRFTAALDTLILLDAYAFMTPYQYYTRVMDRDFITVTKVDSLTYQLDFTRTNFPHTIFFADRFTLWSENLP
ncbi:MAG: DUF2334 domain-containing protein [Candidatus Marinimicrobia bacterium]|nr:DUF2334 domain-containing protein [Candidatus Neomarinimicrobiota bacterium]